MCLKTNILIIHLAPSLTARQKSDEKGGMKCIKGVKSQPNLNLP